MSGPDDGSPPPSSGAGDSSVEQDVNGDVRETSDAALVMAVSRYHQDALAELYRRHAGAVFGLARRLLNEAALAEEIVQEVFVRVATEA